MSRSFGIRRAAAQPRSTLRRLLDLAIAIAILSLVAVIAARLDRVATRQLSGDAVINDGDTITVRGERIRLVGIDAPEYRQTCEKSGATYACGRDSRQALASLAGKGTIQCAGWQRDRYGRLLAVCKVGGVDLNRR